MGVETRNETLKTQAGEMPLFVARPDGAERVPAVVVVQEAFGLNDNIRKITQRLAGAGYYAVAPNFYYRQGGTVVGYDRLQEAIGLMLQWTDDQVVADVRAVVAKLQNDQGVRADRIGITGFCMGGRASYVAACEVPELRASVPYYGGGIAGQQFAPGATPPVTLTAKMKAAIQCHFGEKDSYIPLEAVEEIRRTLEKEKKTFEVHVYEGAGHGFMC
ncbi:MAG: dienelactone hydrolase family protein, partial [Candidatus Binatia bacterium]